MKEAAFKENNTEFESRGLGGANILKRMWKKERKRIWRVW